MQTSFTYADLVRNFIGIINLLMPILSTMAIVFFFYGLVRYIYKAGDVKGRRAGRDAMLWGLIGIFIIFTLWGIIAMLQGFLPLTPALRLQQGLAPL